MTRYSVSRSSRRGVMLLIVTLVLTALTLSGAALLTLMKTEKEATSTRGRKELVHGVARSAVVYLIGCVEQSQEEREKNGGLYDNGPYFCAKPLLTEEEGGEDTSRFTILSPKLEDSRIEGIRYGLVDESTRLNLQAVLNWDKESPGAGRAALMKLPGMTATAADSILDWIDPDEQARRNGAEARYYSIAKLPYSPRNATPVFLEELLLARGVTRAQLYGSDENFTYNAEKTGVEQENSALGGALVGAPAQNARATRSADTIPWTALITVFSAEKDVDPKGAARVDLNVDNLSFLYQELESRVGADLAKFIVLYRQYGPENEPVENSASAPRANRRASGYATGGNRANSGGPGRRSGYISGAANANTNANAASNPNVANGNLSQARLDYDVAATTTLKTPLDIVGARVVVNNVAYPSPIQDSRDNANVTKLLTLLDYASTNDSTTIIGRVNVNAAPRAVLSALPGITTSDVQRIIDDRPDPSKPIPADYRHAVWLYTKGIVDLPQMKNLYDKTTARGDVYRGQIVGFLDNSNEIERAEVVVDGTTEPPRQVFYKDLSTLGKGFSDATLLGGLTTDDANDELAGVSALDWNEATGVVEIERENSGYFDLQTNDPFSAVDAANGTVNGSPIAGTNVDGTNVVGNGLSTDGSDALAAPNASGAIDADATTTGLDAFGGASGTAANASNDSGANASGAASSRRERALNALQSARRSREARNRASAGETSETDDGGGDANVPVPESGAAGPAPSEQTPNARQSERAARQTRGRNSGDASPATGEVAASGAGDASGNDAANAGNNDSSSDRTQEALDALRRARGANNEGRGRGR